MIPGILAFVQFVEQSYQFAIFFVKGSIVYLDATDKQTD
jgi:hypothetical protein